MREWVVGIAEPFGPSSIEQIGACWQAGSGPHLPPTKIYVTNLWYGRLASVTTLIRDLEHMLAHTRGIWDEFSGASIFITGGTGFFGKWLIESFTAANHRHGLNARAVVLTRDATHRISSNPAVSFHTGDMRDFEFPEGSFSHIIHAATPSTGPVEMLDTIVQGTRHVLDFARHCSAKKVLFCSSGAVYGRQPPTLERIPEDYSSAPDSAYGEGKRAAELLCAAYARDTGLQVKIARCFAFLGPHLPLDANFAAGNFLRDAMSGQPICIQGDGTPYRSYLYTRRSHDLAVDHSGQRGVRPRLQRRVRGGNQYRGPGESCG